MTTASTVTMNRSSREVKRTVQHPGGSAPAVPPTRSLAGAADHRPLRSRGLAHARSAPADCSARESLKHRDELLGTLIAGALGLEHAKKLFGQPGGENWYAKLARGLTHQPQVLLLEP